MEGDPSAVDADKPKMQTYRDRQSQAQFDFVCCFASQSRSRSQRTGQTGPKGAALEYAGEQVPNSGAVCFPRSVKAFSQHMKPLWRPCRLYPVATDEQLQGSSKTSRGKPFGSCDSPGNHVLRSTVKRSN